MIQPTIVEEGGAVIFDWSGGLSAEARNVKKTRMGVQVTLKVLDLNSEDRQVIGLDTLIIDSQGDRDRFVAALRQRDGTVPDWDAKMLLVAENLVKRAQDADHRKVVTVVLDTVAREEVSWLWLGRMPFGKLILIDGDPGTGKGWFTLAVATAVTTGGILPGADEPCPVGKVLLLTAEDGLADTVRPRAEDMGADLTRIVVVKGVEAGDDKERHFSLADDLEALDGLLGTGDFRYVIIDPINAYLGSDLDTNRDAAIRSVLAPIAAMAEKHSVVIACVRHLTKGSRDRATYRGLGSIGYTAAARVVLLVGQNPDDPRERVVCCIKNNLTEFPPALAFEIVEGQFRWRGETTVTADALLAPEQGSEERSAQDEAWAFLQELLADGPVTSEQVKREARGAGFSDRTLERSRSQHRDEVKVKRKGELGKLGGGSWYWELGGANNAPAATSEAVAEATEIEPETEPVQKGDSVLNQQLEAPLDPASGDAERAYCLALALEVGYPRLGYAPGNAVPKGQDGWERFTQRMDLGAIKAATAALERKSETDA